MELTYEFLHELLHYDEEDGRLYWKPRGRHLYKNDWAWNWFNQRYAGAVASSLDKHSKRKTYRVVTIFGRKFGEHRLIWWLNYYDDPILDLDHEDHDTENNKIGNLRRVLPSGNAKNRPNRSDNSTGYPGVYPIKSTDKWSVKIYIHGKPKSKSGFNSFEEAKEYKILREKELGYHPNHGKAKN